MLEKIKALFGKQNPKAGRLHAKPDPEGSRVYHEYFLDERADACHWLARVYAENGAPTEQEGHEADRISAAKAAIAWAEKTKDGLRGVQ